MHRTLLPLCCTALLAVMAAAARPADSADRALADPCEQAEGAHSADLYCMALVPTPGVSGVRAEVELRWPPSPFTLAVSEDGTVRFAPVFRIQGLPDPGDLGPYGAYVAWIVTPTFSDVRKLGEVRNGETSFPAVAYNKFMVLVSAEASPDVEQRSGRLVLRGFSPSTRRQPADVLEFAIGSGRPGDTGNEIDTAHEHPSADHGDGGDGDWPRPPMPPNLSMLPAMMALAPPPVTPFLPSVEDPSTIEPVRPRELRRMRDGDTLALDARYVRRRLWGREFIAYGFNGQLPGPLIHVPKDAEIVVRFTNSIDWPATVHWHGIRVENRFDGVPHITQEPVAPGDSFTYRLRFPDEGIYWYHPHHREDVLKELGLYGNILVQHPEPDYWSPVDREELLVLDDFLMTEEGPFPLGLERATHAFMGRFGNVMLVNGEPDYRLDVTAGEVVRFFLTNVSNTRTFNLSFPGARLKVVGSDIGAYEREEWAESVVLAPAERYVVHVRFDRAGRVPLLNRVQAVDHLFGAYLPRTDTLGMVVVGPEAAAQASGPADERASAFDQLRPNAYVAADIARLREHFDRPVDRELVLSLETGELPFVVDRLMRLDSAYFEPVEWSGSMPVMNWASTGREVRWILRDPATGRENMDVQWRFRVGDVVKIRLHNERRVLHGMHHPIHIHGQRFLVLAVNGVRSENLAWKDTVLLPTGSTADVLLELSNPGTWMLHCHISEHLEAGMRMTFIVDPA